MGAVEGLVFLLLRVEEENLLLPACMILQRHPLDIEILPADQNLYSAHFQSLKRVLHTKTVFASVLGNLIKVPSNQLFLLDELDIGQRFCSKLNGLIEAILAARRYPQV